MDLCIWTDHDDHDHADNHNDHDHDDNHNDHNHYHDHDDHCLTVMPAGVSKLEMIRSGG